MIRLFLALAAAGLLAAGEPGFPAHFVGGTIPGVSTNSRARLDLNGTDALLFRCHGQTVSIPYQKVNTLEYGQNVSRRYAEAILISPILLLSKSRKHYVTIGYVDPAGAQQALVVRVEKGDIRSVLASLEARTGRRVEFLDDEARKGGQ